MGTCRICGKPSVKRDHDGCAERWRWTDPKFYRPKILERDQNTCEHCGGRFADEDLQIDHILALVNGGAHGHPALYQTLCAPVEGGGCHRRKSATEQIAEEESSMGRRVAGVTVLVLTAAMVVRYLELPYGYVVVWTALFAYALVGLSWMVREVRDRRRRRRVALHELFCAETGVPVSRLSATRSVWKDLKPARVEHRFSRVTFTPTAESLARLAGVLSATYDQPMTVAMTMVKGTPVLVASVGEHELVPEDKDERLPVKLASVMGDVSVDVRFSDGEASKVTIKYPTVFADQNDARRQEVFEVVNQSMPGRWRLEWDPPSDTVVAFRRPDMPGRVDRPVPSGDMMAVPLGPDEDGGVRSWLPKTQAHLLVAGETGAGKSVTVSGVIMFCLATGWEAIIVDGKGTTLAGFARWPGVIDSGFGDPAGMSRALVKAEQVMDRRYAKIRAEDLDPDQFTPLLVVIDEATLMMSRLEAWWAGERGRGDPRTPPGVQAWKNIAVAGREARVHLVLGIQQAAAGDFDGTQIRDQFGARVALGPTSPESARMMFRDSHVGRDLPVGAKGRATVALASSIAEAQTYYSPELKPSGNPRNPDDEGAVRQWRHLAERAHPEPARERTRPARVHELEPKQKVLMDGSWVTVVRVDPAVGAEDDEAEIEMDDGRHALVLPWDEVVTVLDSD